MAMFYQDRLLTTMIRRSLQQPIVDRPTRRPRLWRCHYAAPNVTRAQHANIGLTAIEWQARAVVKNRGCRVVSRNSLCEGA